MRVDKGRQAPKVSFNPSHAGADRYTHTHVSHIHLQMMRMQPVEATKSTVKASEEDGAELIGPGAGQPGRARKAPSSWRDIQGGGQERSGLGGRTVLAIIFWEGQGQ